MYGEDDGLDSMMEDRISGVDHIDADACFGGDDVSEFDDEPDFDDDSHEDGLTDVEADAMTLASAGWGTDEDYGFYEGE